MELKQNNEKKTSHDKEFLTHLNEIGSKLKLSKDVRNKAHDLIEPIFHELNSHYDEVYLAAGSLIIASRIKETPRSIPQASEVIRKEEDYLDELNKKEHQIQVRKHFNKIRDTRCLDLNPVKSGRLIEGTLEMLEQDIDKEVIQKSKELSEIVDEKIEFCDISQAGLAASLIYISSRKIDGRCLNAPQLEKASGRNPKTIRGTARKIINCTDIEDYN